MIVTLSIIWDEYGKINETLLNGEEADINNFIYENYDNSEQIRDSDKFKMKIDNFLKGKPEPSIKKNYRGSIVILKSNDDLTIGKLKVMYKKDVDNSIEFIKQLYNRMCNDRTYTKKILGLYPQLFLESERIALYTDLKYDCKSYYKINLKNWKNKFIQNENYIHNLRILYKCFEKDIQEIKKQKEKILKEKSLIEDNFRKTDKKEELLIKDDLIEEYEKEEFLTEEDYKYVKNYDDENDEYKEEPKQFVKQRGEQLNLFDLE